MKTKIQFEVDICLATYNGSRFLKEFYNSISIQTKNNWNLIVRDDGSTDSTKFIIDSLSVSDKRVSILSDSLGNLGVIGNFSRLLNSSRSPYIMLADQDDIWDNDKIQISIEKITLMEKIYGSDVPCLVFTDLKIVDENLSLISNSFFKHQNISSKIPPNFQDLLVQNFAPGCTMIFNRALLRYALPIPKEVGMHDWWLIQVASLIGKIDVIRRPTIAYRQHSSNQVGAMNSGFSITKLFSIIKTIRNYKVGINYSSLQASLLLQILDEKLTPEQKNIISIYCNLHNLPIPLRQYTAAKHGFQKAGTLRNIGYYFLM